MSFRLAKYEMIFMIPDQMLDLEKKMQAIWGTSQGYRQHPYLFDLWFWSSKVHLPGVGRITGHREFLQIATSSLAY